VIQRANKTNSDSDGRTVATQASCLGNSLKIKIRKRKVTKKYLSTKDKYNKHNLNNDPPSPNMNIQNPCESKDCTDEIFAACVKCLSLLCIKHFDESEDCKNHTSLTFQQTGQATRHEEIITTPQNYLMEGSLREEPQLKKKRENKQRSGTSKEYLHKDLNLTKMVNVFCSENGTKLGCIATYTKVFKEMNLSFHRPKKDKCTLCTTYREGDNDIKAKLEEKFYKHIEEKKKLEK